MRPETPPKRARAAALLLHALLLIPLAAAPAMDMIAPYGASVTDADILMTDGRSLEHVGVSPDKASLPSAADMAAGRDPVLAEAAALLGATLDPEKAGTLFPVKWRK